MSRGERREEMEEILRKYEKQRVTEWNLRASEGSRGLGGKRGARDREEMREEMDKAFRKRDERVREEMGEWIKVVEERKGERGIW